jgi:hypothetical protein
VKDSAHHDSDTMVVTASPGAPCACVVAAKVSAVTNWSKARGMVEGRGLVVTLACDDPSIRRGRQQTRAVNL